MKWEITVSDKLGSWGTAGKLFHPGIYVTENEAIAEAALHAGPYVTVRELVEEEENAPVGEAEVFDVAGETEAKSAAHTPLAVTDLYAPEPVGYTCSAEGCDAPPFKSKAALLAHTRRRHKDEAPSESPEAFEEPAEFFEEPAEDTKPVEE